MSKETDSNEHTHRLWLKKINFSVKASLKSNNNKKVPVKRKDYRI